MTHKDIYTKFMIEYDKANVTSSYPSLTEYEVATLLDKAYYALIAQKLTGNNVRRAPFEADTKAIEDLRALIKQEDATLTGHATPSTLTPGMWQGDVFQTTPTVTNLTYTNVPTKSLYVLKVILSYEQKGGTPMDGENTRSLTAKMVNHDIAEKFYSSAYNMPWVKQPVFYLEDNKIYIVYDPINKPKLDTASIMYIQKPNSFVKDSNILSPKNGETRTYFQVRNGSGNDITSTISEYNFECNDSVAEELISLAISFALENVESPRLNTKLNMRGLEA